MSYRNTVSGLAAVVAMAVSLGCETAKSANPTSPSVAGPIPGVSITAPRPLEPFSGSELVAEGQLVSLLIENAGTSGPRSLWMQIEMAADASFQQVLHQADRVDLGANGRTTYRLPSPLAAGHTYYWRVRALDGANTGPYSAVSNFKMVAPVVIEAPVPVEPAGTLTTNRPQFKVNNPKFSGTSEVIVRFEVFATQDLSQVVAVVTSGLGSGGSTSMSLGDLPWNKTYFWRAYATDFVASSPPSLLVQFKTAPEPRPVETPGSGPLPPDTGSVGGPRTISPNEALQIIKSIHDLEGWNLGSRSSRQERISFWWRAVAVLHYGHSRYNPKGPDSDWCVKDAGGGRPPSDDVLVRCRSREAFDVIASAGADGYRFHMDSIGALPLEQNVYPPPRSSLPR
ncbi:MAG: hypothetical protein ACRD2N_01570 [Vicinamibacterales bacterium]